MQFLRQMGKRPLRQICILKWQIKASAFFERTAFLTRALSRFAAGLCWAGLSVSAVRTEPSDAFVWLDFRCPKARPA